MCIPYGGVDVYAVLCVEPNFEERRHETDTNDSYNYYKIRANINKLNELIKLAIKGSTWAKKNPENKSNGTFRIYIQVPVSEYRKRVSCEELLRVKRKAKQLVLISLILVERVLFWL